MDKKTIKEVLDEAFDKAWETLMNTLTENGVKFDDSDVCLWVDDTEAKKTYSIDITMNEAEEYEGD